MLALIMAGGKGIRLGCAEKPLALLHNTPLISYVIDAFSGYELIVATSDNTPYTRNWCRALGIDVVRSEGAGYCEDLVRLLSEIDENGPLFSVSSDLPTISSSLINNVKESFEMSGCESCSVWTPVTAYDRLGLARPDSYDLGQVMAVASGLNIIHGGINGRSQTEHCFISQECDCLINVNTPEELAALQRWTRPGVRRP